MAAKIVIEVRGGVVQEVYCDDPTIKIVLIDWDNDEAGHPVQFPTTPISQMPNDDSD